MEFEQTKRILAAFERHKVAYVLVGRMAMAAQELVRATRDFDIEGVRVRAATPRMLYRMKKDTVRSQDRLDGQILRERFDLQDD